MESILTFLSKTGEDQGQGDAILRAIQRLEDIKLHRTERAGGQGSSQIAGNSNSSTYASVASKGIGGAPLSNTRQLN